MAMTWQKIRLGSGRPWLRRAGIVLAPVVLAFVAAFFIDEPLRRVVVRQRTVA